MSAAEQQAPVAAASPFVQMAAVLTAAPPALAVTTRPPGMTRVAAMRALLRQGRQCAADLGRVAGVQSSMVQGLLKNDLAQGIVRKLNGEGKAFYELSDEGRIKLLEQLRDAKALLLKHGYAVIGKEDTEILGERLGPLPPPDVVDPGRFGVLWREDALRRFGAQELAAEHARIVARLRQEAKVSCPCEDDANFANELAGILVAEGPGGPNEL
ncbi:MAG: MarR family winged helix-turn-helix transcriptional regulator [Rubrivivax sp.]|nr:MarR family winged helix-turn-helix transcriptional regulator [Rubrivivax sp.]